MRSPESQEAAEFVLLGKLELARYTYRLTATQRGSDLPSVEFSVHAADLGYWLLNVGYERVASAIAQGAHVEMRVLGSNLKLLLRDAI